ncbi:MAG: ATP-binding protein [Muribaculaceae bacterium]|nr:ATP-binding protein [Muribaculaceae bacterium]
MSTMVIKRLLQEKISKRITPGKVVIIYGARRVGKTVLLRELVNLFEGKTLLLNGEDYDVQSMLANRSVANYRHLFNGVELVAIDEAQNIPNIGSVLKLMVDEIDELSVIASGSSSFDLLNKTGEPLVGRSVKFQLTPLSCKEILSVETPFEMSQNLEQRMLYGMYPEVVTMSSNDMRIEYLREIVDSYLLKDILAVDGIKNASKMQNLLRLIALQVGSEVSYDELGTQLGMSKNTVERYLDLLSKVFVVYRVGAFARNIRKEVCKAGKWYFYDNGVRNAILNNFSPLAVRNDVGHLWENYFLSERRKYIHNNLKYIEQYFWRTYDKQELDLVEECDGNLLAMEIKWGKKTPKLPNVFANAYQGAEFQVINKDNYLDWV